MTESRTPDGTVQNREKIRLGDLLLGMADPLDLMAIDEVEKRLKKNVEPAIVREAELLATLDSVYRRTGEIESIAVELEGELRESDFDLANMWVESYLVASALRGIMAQWLLRKVCEECNQTYKPEVREQLWLNNLLRDHI